MTTSAPLILHTYRTTWPFAAHMPCMWPEEEPDLNLSSAGATRAWSDIPPAVHWLGYDREGTGKALWATEQKPRSVGDWIPLISGCLKVWKQAHLRITGKGIAAPVSAPVYAPTATSHQQSLLLPALALPLLAVLKLKTAAWNTRLMKPCLEVSFFSFSSCSTIIFY